MIESRDYAGRKLILVRKGTGIVMERGYTVSSDRICYVVQGGAAPNHSNSSGRVYVTEAGTDFERSFFPHVVGLEWSTPYNSEDRRYL